mgnify:CR=1 FL=1
MGTPDFAVNPLHALAEAGYEVGKVDVDKEPSLAQQYKIMSIPTLLVFKGGKRPHVLWD